MTKIRVFLTALALLSFGPLWWLLWYLPRHRIGDLETYGIFVFIALMQAVVVVFSGYLAIASMPAADKDKREKKYQGAFAVLGTLLFLSTCAIGYLNDKSQVEAKAKTEELNGHLIEATTALAVIKSCKQTPECSQAAIVGFINHTLNRLPPQYVPPAAVTPPIKEEIAVPFSSLSDKELSDKAREFSSHLLSGAFYIADLSDKYGIAQRHQYTVAQFGQPVTPDVVQATASAKNALDDFMNRVVQQDAPLATDYRTALLARLGSRAKTADIPPAGISKFMEFPQPLMTEMSSSRFLNISSTWLRTWADQLAPPH